MKEFFETQTRDKSDQKSAIQKNFVILTMVIMNTKEATADFCFEKHKKHESYSPSHFKLLLVILLQ